MFNMLHPGVHDIVAEYTGFHEFWMMFNHEPSLRELLPLTPSTSSQLTMDHYHWGIETPEKVMQFVQRIHKTPEPFLPYFRSAIKKEATRQLKPNSEIQRILHCFLCYVAAQATAYGNDILEDHILHFLDLTYGDPDDHFNSYHLYLFEAALIHQDFRPLRVLNRVNVDRLLEVFFSWLPHRRACIIRLLQEGFFWLNYHTVFQNLVLHGENELAFNWIEGRKRKQREEIEKYGFPLHVKDKTLMYEKLLSFPIGDYLEEMTQKEHHSVVRSSELNDRDPFEPEF
jgi:hypothetical protein